MHKMFAGDPLAWITGPVGNYLATRPSGTLLATYLSLTAASLVLMVVRSGMQREPGWMCPAHWLAATVATVASCGWMYVWLLNAVDGAVNGLTDVSSANFILPGTVMMVVPLLLLLGTGPLRDYRWSS